MWSLLAATSRAAGGTQLCHLPSITNKMRWLHFLGAWALQSPQMRMSAQILPNTLPPAIESCLGTFAETPPLVSIPLFRRAFSFIHVRVTLALPTALCTSKPTQMLTVVSYIYSFLFDIRDMRCFTDATQGPAAARPLLANRLPSNPTSLFSARHVPQKEGDGERRPCDRRGSAVPAGASAALEGCCVAFTACRAVLGTTL
jgi:hypothetical protein